MVKNSVERTIWTILLNAESLKLIKVILRLYFVRILIVQNSGEITADGE
jgi:hypothetical protein